MQAVLFRFVAARSVGSPALRVAVTVCVVAAISAVQSAANSDQSLLEASRVPLAAAAYLGGVTIIGMPLVGDLRNGMAALILGRGVQLRHYLVSQFVMGGFLVAATIWCVTVGLAAAQLLGPDPLRMSFVALVLSVVSVLALAAIGGVVTLVPGLFGSSRGGAGAVAIVFLLALVWIAPPSAGPTELLSFATPRNAAGVAAWTAAASASVVAVPWLAKAARTKERL